VIKPNSWSLSRFSQDDKEVTNEILINSQESVITDDGQLKDLITDEGQLKDLMATKEANKTEKINDDSQSKDAPPERRRSERLKEILLTTLEKNEMMAKQRSLEGNDKKSYSISDISNDVLGNLAKDMGVLVQNNDFATFDMLKDLENTRNCLYAKHTNKNVLNSCVEIEEFVPEEEKLVLEDDHDSESDLGEMVILQSKEKSKVGKKKFKFSPGGRKQDQEDLGLLDSRIIPVNLNKRKNKGKNDSSRFILEL